MSSVPYPSSNRCHDWGNMCDPTETTMIPLGEGQYAHEPLAPLKVCRTHLQRFGAIIAPLHRNSLPTLPKTRLIPWRCKDAHVTLYPVPRTPLNPRTPTHNSNDLNQDANGYTHAAASALASFFGAFSFLGAAAFFGAAFLVAGLAVAVLATLPVLVFAKAAGLSSVAGAWSG